MWTGYCGGTKCWKEFYKEAAWISSRGRRLTEGMEAVYAGRDLLVLIQKVLVEFPHLDLSMEQAVRLEWSLAGLDPWWMRRWAQDSIQTSGWGTHTSCFPPAPLWDITRLDPPEKSKGKKECGTALMVFAGLACPRPVCPLSSETGMWVSELISVNKACSGPHYSWSREAGLKRLLSQKLLA